MMEGRDYRQWMVGAGLVVVDADVEPSARCPFVVDPERLPLTRSHDFEVLKCPTRASTRGYLHTCSVQHVA